MASAKAPSLKQATGILITDDRVIAAIVAKRVLGSGVAETIEVPIGEGGIAGAIGQLIADGKLRGNIVCAMDAARVLSITRRLSPEEAQQTPSEVLGSRLGQIEGGLAGASEQVKLPRGMYQRLMACRRDTARGLLHAFKGVKRTRIRLAPLLPVLFDRALATKAAPRKWRAHIRLLLGEHEGFAMLAFGKTLLASRRFAVTGWPRMQSIETAVLSLVTEAREQLGIPAVQGIMVHAQEGDTSTTEACTNACGLAAQLAPAVALDDAAACAALAATGLKPKRGAVNLFAELMPPPGLKQNFPIKAAAMLVLTTAISGWMLHDETAVVEREAARFEQKAKALAKRVHTDLKDLKPEHEKLKKELEIAHGFIMNRLFWTEFLQEMPDVLPPSVTLMDFDGRDTVQPWKAKTGTTGHAGRKLSISGQVLMDGMSVSPPEVHEITSSLKQSELFSDYLPSITGANVRMTPGAEGMLARIVVVCLPKGT